MAAVFDAALRRRRRRRDLSCLVPLCLGLWVLSDGAVGECGVFDVLRPWRRRRQPSVAELRQEVRDEVLAVRHQVHELVTALDRRAAAAVDAYYRAKGTVRDLTASYYRDDSLASLALVGGINVVVLASALGFIGIMQSCVGTARLRDLFAPRLQLAAGAAGTFVGDAVLPPPRLGLRMILWPRVVMSVTDDDFLFSCGIDAFALNRIVLMGLRFCWFALLPSSVLLILYGWDDTSGKAHYGANRVSLGNVPVGSWASWAPVPFAYYLVALASAMLWKEARIFSVSYRRYLVGLCRKHHPLSHALRTVLVEDVPQGLSSESALQGELERLLGKCCVESITFRGNGVGHPRRVLGGTHVSGVAFAMLRRTARVLRGVVCWGEATGVRHALSALVTFRSHATTLHAVQLKLSDDFEVRPAPYPSDVVPANVGCGRSLVLWRSAAVDALLFLGLLLWSVPITAIQAVASMSNLKLIFGLDLDEGTQAYALLTQYLPIVAWLSLLQLLQGAFWLIAERYESAQTYSEIQLRTMRRYWTYTLCTMYVTVLSGSLLDSVANILQRPGQIIWFLGQSVPQVSVYFVSLVLSKGMLSLPFCALRPGAFAAWACQALAGPRSRGAGQPGSQPGGRPGCRAFPWASSEEERFVAIQYSQVLPDVLLVFTVCVTFAPLAPLVVPAGAVFFGIACLVYRFGALYTWRAPFQGQGRFFAFFLSQALSTLPVAVLILMASLALLHGYPQAFALAPLFGGALMFRNGALQKMQVLERLPLTLAGELDS